MNKAISTERGAKASAHRAGWLLLALLLCGVWSAAAMAQGQSRDCTLTLAPLSFGNYDPLETTVPQDRATTMRVSCRNNTFVRIFYSTGSSGSFAQRTMRQGTSQLAYNFYFEPARVSILGDGTGGSFFLQGTVGQAGANITLYGRIPPGQDPSVGLHSDTIIVTMTF
ncbi:MAG: spore coat U domain-containing protein [Xanthomonadaceae bacterium]|nr:spore coat U domain-containing protein [Xanthomonadaceae bacterium]MDP2185428.1 spore coat U domain-containing protein [Xanthomonadales bacterium]MDZ4116224.1 spore coat U domain-containing protein [Xanthomonadaceae bacterium]MDZ4376996.1 spore coat U domain-containing protein [Xanthomonadaceae bacterium]